MPKLLLVDDDPAFRSLARIGLEDEGHVVHEAEDAEMALYELSIRSVDCILVDLRLPGMDGLSLLREVAHRGPIPMIAVTAHDEPDSIIAGLEAGADDYVTKPVQLKELDARIRAVLRRAASPGAPLVSGPVVIYPRDGRVERNGEPVILTATERRLLMELASKPHALRTREDLLERVWARDALSDPRVVDVYIRRVRIKVEPDPAAPRLVRTVRGLGYRFVP